MHCESPIKRRLSRKIWVGSVPVGGDAPIAVQSMTNTDTNDVAATVAQIRRLEDAGADIVRVSVPESRQTQRTVFAVRDSFRASTQTSEVPSGVNCTTRIGPCPA